LHIDDDSGILEEGSNYLAVYPNPFSDFTTIRFAKELSSPHIIIVYDIVGSEIYRIENVTGKFLQINKNELGNGLFILTVIEQESGTQILSTKLLTE
jgi:hypothetical protein